MQELFQNALLGNTEMKCRSPQHRLQLDWHWHVNLTSPRKSTLIWSSKEDIILILPNVLQF